MVFLCSYVFVTVIYLVFFLWTTVTLSALFFRLETEQVGVDFVRTDRDETRSVVYWHFRDVYV